MLQTEFLRTTGSSPVFPHRRQRDPEPAVTPDYARTMLFAPVNGKLLTQGEILQDECVRTFSEQPNKPK